MSIDLVTLRMDPWARPAIEPGQYLRHRGSKARTAYFVISSKQTKETAFILKCQRLPIADIPEDAEVRQFTWHPRVKRRKANKLAAHGPVIQTDFHLNDIQKSRLLYLRGGCQCSKVVPPEVCSRCETPPSVAELMSLRDYFLTMIMQRGARTPLSDEPMPEDYLSIEHYLASREDSDGC